MTQSRILSRKFASALLILILSAGLFQAMPALPALAQEAAPVQEIQGKVSPGEIDIFVLSGLKRGQTLSATLDTTSGNLDPVLSLVPATADLPTLIADYRAEVQNLVQSVRPATG